MIRLIRQIIFDYFKLFVDVFFVVFGDSALLVGLLGPVAAVRLFMNELGGVSLLVNH